MKKQSETPARKQLQNVVAQQVTTVSEKGVSKDEKQSEKTVIVVDKNQDIDKWVKYARTYWNRSQLPAKNADQKATRQKNYNKYLDYKELLETSGVIEVTEREVNGKKELIMKKK